MLFVIFGRLQWSFQIGEEYLSAKIAALQKKILEIPQQMSHKSKTTGTLRMKALFSQIL